MKNFRKLNLKSLIELRFIAICMQRAPQDRLEDWEELAAVAMAVQNMWLTAAQYGIGAYWGSPKAIKKVGHFLSLAEGERCLGFLFMGYVDQATRPAIRSSLSERVTWME